MIKTYLVIPFLKYLIRKEAFLILFSLVRATIKERRNDGSDSIFHSKPDGKKTILALDSLRYRGDLDALSQNFRVLHLTQRGPGWLIKGFYHEFDIVKYINAPDGSDKKAQYIAASNFMTKFLKVFYSKVSVDCVTTVNFRYTEDHHWVKSSEEVGIPHIMLYREGLLTYYRAEYNLFFRAKRFDKFIGSHIIVHNEKCKSIFLDAEIVSKDKISVAGALRMDSLVSKVNNYHGYKKIKRNKKVTLFYFQPNMPMFGVDAKGVVPKGYLSRKPEKDLSYAFEAWSGRYDLFYDVHETIIKLAYKYKDIDFIVKPKDVMVNSSQWKYYDMAVEKSEVDVSSLENYSIEPYSNVHDLIFSSDVVCAMNSSTALESAFIGKPVILPVFKEYRDSKNFEDFHWKDDLSLFDVADDKYDFERLILQRLDDDDIDMKTATARNELFYKWFDQPKEGALSEYTHIINTVIDKYKKG
jgi:hypothetical protein